MERKWLRRYDNKAGRWTNQVYPYTDELAKEIDMRLIDDDEAQKCQAALLVEKKEAARIRREKDAYITPTVIPAMNKVVPPTADDVELATDPLPPAPVVEDVAPIQDELDGLTKLDLQNLIDSEDLGVKKIGNKPELIVAIRLARQAKQEKTASAPVADIPNP